MGERHGGRVSSWVLDYVIVHELAHSRDRRPLGQLLGTRQPLPRPNAPAGTCRPSPGSRAANVRVLAVTVGVGSRRSFQNAFGVNLYPGGDCRRLYSARSTSVVI